MKHDQISALLQLGMMAVAFVWPILFARRGVLSPARWLILALGFFVVAAFAGGVGYQARIRSIFPEQPGDSASYSLVSWICVEASIHVGVSAVGSIFAAAFHRKPAPKKKYAHSSFLLDDRKW